MEMCFKNKREEANASKLQKNAFENTKINNFQMFFNLFVVFNLLRSRDV